MRRRNRRRRRRLDGLELLLDGGALFFNRRSHRGTNLLRLLRVSILHEKDC